MTRSDGGPIISGSHVRMATRPIVISERCVDGIPQVSLRHSGDLITEIHIRCGCGELMILDCEYGLPGGGQPPQRTPQPV